MSSKAFRKDCIEERPSAVLAEKQSGGGAQVVGRRLAGTAIGHDLVGDLLALTQRTKASALDSRDVHEHILAAVIRLDEAVALGGVKPFHGSHAHGGSSLLR